MYTIVMLCCLSLLAYGFFTVYFPGENQADPTPGWSDESSDKEQELPKEAGEAANPGTDPENATAPGELQTLTVHFLDVGQGDCTLLQCGGQTMLIDAGEEDRGTAIQYYLKKQGIERLDYLVLTHPDSDHIGSADVVLTKFEVDRVLMTDYEKDNSSYRNLMDTMEYYRLQPEYPSCGDSFALGSAVCTVLGPTQEYEESNNASLCLLIENGENEFLFTGDAEEAAEEDLLELPLQADVYKAGHHGSNTSSSEEFLDAVTPSYTVISCGKDNSYGHPHEEVLKQFAARGVKVYRTDTQGNVVAVADGEEIIWRCERDG